MSAEMYNSEDADMVWRMGGITTSERKASLAELIRRRAREMGETPQHHLEQLAAEMLHHNGMARMEAESHDPDKMAYGIRLLALEDLS